MLVCVDLMDFVKVQQVVVEIQLFLYVVCVDGLCEVIDLLQVDVCVIEIGMCGCDVDWLEIDVED